MIFDVGANVGEYTEEVLKLIPDANVHCFEPSKKTYAKLNQRISSGNVVLNNIGISDKKTESVLFSDKEESGLASLYNRKIDYYGIELSSTETVLLTTLDSYCKENDIAKIDFLKMDIEGNEYNALLGAKDLIENDKVDAIQIEFGGCNIDSRTYFKDYWYLLKEKYNFYRILKNGLYKIDKYDEFLEQFLNTNYMILRKGLYH